MSNLDKDIKLDNGISQFYIYELLLKPNGITLEEAEKVVKPLTLKDIQRGLMTGKTPKKLLIRLYQRYRQRQLYQKFFRKEEFMNKDLLEKEIYCLA